MEAPGGRRGDVPRPDRAGDFSPRLPRFADPSPAGFRPDVSGNLPGPREASLKTTDERFPLDRPRHPPGRQLDGLPGGGARSSMGAVSDSEDQFGSFRALIGLGFGVDRPRIKTGRSPLPLRERVARRAGWGVSRAFPTGLSTPHPSACGRHLLPQGEKGHRALLPRLGRTLHLSKAAACRTGRVGQGRRPAPPRRGRPPGGPWATRTVLRSSRR